MFKNFTLLMEVLHLYLLLLIIKNMQGVSMVIIPSPIIPNIFYFLEMIMFKVQISKLPYPTKTLGMPVFKESTLQPLGICGLCGAIG
jgi:hypothetical protein